MMGQGAGKINVHRQVWGARMCVLMCDDLPDYKNCLPVVK